MNEEEKQKILEEQETMMMYDTYNVKIKQTIKEFFVLLLIFIVLMIINKSLDASYSKCVKSKGLTGNCGLGALCNAECFPKGYFIVGFLNAIYSGLIFPFIFTPCFLISYLYYAYKRNKYKR